MARSPLIIALAAGLVIVLSTVNILHRLDSPLLNFPWQRRGGYYPLDLPETSTAEALSSQHETRYLLGVGKGDITGPVVEVNFMGYADPSQLGTGLRQRLYSRAFIVGDINNPEDRFVYLVLDTQSGDTAIRYGILQALANLGSEYSMYGQQNIAVTGTHSHSGPGAWLNYLLPQITSKGFHMPSYQAIVDGAVASIVEAHERLASGRLSVGTIDIAGANINRSPYAYLANPAEERERYKHDVDKEMTVLRFTHEARDGQRDIGILTWFPVHGTSMYGNNTLVTGDNKGVAAWLFEKSTNDIDFVAGFSQANVGDTSPNVLGAYCEYGEQVGELCDFKTSLCGKTTQPCHGRGPYFGRDDGGTDSTFEIGIRQFEYARLLFNDKTSFTPVDGSVVKSVHHFVDLSNYHFTLANGTVVRTCPAALGYSFAAGTSDGPGAFDFKQAQPGDPHANPLWSLIGNRVHKPNDTQKACHTDKVILLDVGESNNPYEWSPNIVDVQLLRVGQMVIIVSPGEATTMAGRRWREAVHDKALDTFVPPSTRPKVAPVVVLGGPSNTYTHYITTQEEYSIQRYEGASTLYGPHTLDSYINLTLTYLPELSASASNSPHSKHGPSPPILINDSLSFITPVIVDRAPFWGSFGDVKQDVNPTYKPGDTVEAVFVGANPRNNFRLGSTFAAVEKFDFDSRTWRQIKDDSDWTLVYEWKRTNSAYGSSEVTIKWETRWETGKWETGQWETGQWQRENEALTQLHGDLLVRNTDDLKGYYRLRYFGDAKALGGDITAFEGRSREFRFE